MANKVQIKVTPSYIVSDAIDKELSKSLDITVKNLFEIKELVISDDDMFTGSNAVDNKGFDAGIGDWVQGSGGVLTSDSDGQTGNGGKYVVGGVPSVTLPLLSAGLTNLVVSDKYKLGIYLKYNTNWDGGDVTITIDGQTIVLTPTTSYVQKTLELTASGTSPTISVTCASAPTTGDILFIDTISLDHKQVDISIVPASITTISGAVVFTDSNIIIKTKTAGEDQTIPASGAFVRMSADTDFTGILVTKAFGNDATLSGFIIQSP